MAGSRRQTTAEAGTSSSGGSTSDRVGRDGVNAASGTGSACGGKSMMHLPRCSTVLETAIEPKTVAAGRRLIGVAVAFRTSRDGGTAVNSRSRFGCSSQRDRRLRVGSQCWRRGKTGLRRQLLSSFLLWRIGHRLRRRGDCLPAQLSLDRSLRCDKNVWSLSRLVQLQLFERDRRLLVGLQCTEVLIDWNGVKFSQETPFETTHDV